MVTHDLPKGPGPRPEQRELHRLWARIHELREAVIEGERRLVLYRQTLAAFEHDYLLRCGRRYAELDALEAEIAERLAARAPTNVAASTRARVARAKARQTIVDSRERERTGPSRTVVQTPETKAVYRQAARCFHPDLAPDEPTRAVCHDYMVQLNAAYERGDVERMEQLVIDWKAGLGPAEDRPPGDQLVEALRIIDQLEQRLSRIATDHAAAEQGEIGALHATVEDARSRGEDLIEALILDLDEQIANTRARLEELRDDVSE